MKRMICALLAVVLLLGLAGCKKDTENQLEESQMTLEAETTEETAEETTEEMTEETVEETETTEETEATVAPCAEHTWGEWVRWEKPSTTTEGKRVRTCVVCGEEDVEIEPTLPKTTNHTHKYKVEKATATCLEDGWAYYYCSCGDWYEVPLKATGHKWGSWKFTKIPTDTAKGLKVAVEYGKLRIVQEGAKKKFVKQVEHITFSGIYANKVHQPVLYITERAVFELRPEGVTLVEIAPGIDLQTQILDQMEFVPPIAYQEDGTIKLMDARIFRDEPMGLK